jgi:cobalamin biosynthesis protein CobD/CbiB
MNWLRSRIARSPMRALVLGKIVFLAGAILILGALFARAGLMWPVAEGPMVFILAAVLVLAGMGLTVLAEKAVRQERAQAGRPQHRP